jgi:hypothetical protein
MEGVAIMQTGQTVYRAFRGGVADDRPPLELIYSGTVVEVVRNGVTVQGVEREYGGGMIEPLTEEWRSRHCDALRDHHREMVRYIGFMQAKADEMAARILHEDLVTEEATNGVA